ncbi:hypothetical protein F53441_6517 [Fusarium austroafricanum]|uniref:Uncharacterized protein n=1 Tax=Fusarium austroafricanum TaxID=2364996 RepID=A0A8H4NYL0_9HYPO|nr:hypothetical protein F53441_6517 [Fusarium austroafricanum]
MQAKNLFTTLLAALPAVQAFKFTGPDPSKALDVNDEWTITWSGGIPGNLSPKFDFGWHCEPDEFNIIESDISQMTDDIYLSDRQYAHKFGTVFHGMLDKYADNLAKTPLFYFQAIFKDQNGKEVMYLSQNYTLTGLDKGSEPKSDVEL